MFFLYLLLCLWPVFFLLENFKISLSLGFLNFTMLSSVWVLFLFILLCLVGKTFMSFSSGKFELFIGELLQ